MRQCVDCNIRCEDRKNGMGCTQYRVNLEEAEIKDSKTSTVDHPSHYNQNKIETIDSIKSITGDKFDGYLLGNVVKYIGRYKYKNGVEDLKKAVWHLEKLIKEIEEKEIQK